jgi:Cu2+-exporting ATPase
MQIKTNTVAAGKLAFMPVATVANPEISGQLPPYMADGGRGAVVGRADGAVDTLHLLDDPQEWAAFSHPDAHNPELVESNLVVDGITCSACAITIEQALRAMPGVLRADVSAATRRATVLWSPASVQPSGWMGAIRKVGYRPVPANDSSARAARLQESRTALWRWLVAGLCMMQVMMYAYPAYVALPGDLSAESERLLRWASWVLTLPVMLFSCGPFFRSALRDLVQRRISMDLPVAIALAITFAVSSAGTFDPQGMFGREVFFDSLTMFVFFLLTGRWLELRLRDRTAGALESMVNRMPDAVQRQRPDGSFEAVAVRRLVVGDVLRVLPGEAIAADGVITRGTTMVDQALLTGESKPVACETGAHVMSGSFNLSGVIELRVAKTGGDTRFAAVVALVHSAATAKPRLAQLADRIAKPFLIVVLLAATCAAAYWWPAGPGHALMVAVAVLIVTCPCALSLATPTAMLAAAGSLARGGVLVRRLQALEALAGVDSVVFDKTGTLTRDGLRLDEVTMREGVTRAQVLAMAGAMARQSLHPVSRALADAAAAQGQGGNWLATDVTEHAGMGVSATVHPAGDDASHASMRLGSRRFCGLSDADPESGLTHLVDSSGWLGTFTLRQDMRLDAASTVSELVRDGLQVHMLSGDKLEAAQQVAGALGIASVLAECSPDAKLAFLRTQQAAGRRVAMVGDGLNDAPVLAGADVSFAMGHATPLAQSQADFVVQGGQLERIAQTLRLARRTMRVVRQNLGWALAYNMACIPLAVVGWIPAWLAGLGMAGSSLLVVLNALRLAGPLQQGVD